MFKFLKKKKQEDVSDLNVEEIPVKQEKAAEHKGEKFMRDEMRIQEGANEEFEVLEEKEQKRKRQDSEWMIYGIVVVFMVILVAAATYLALKWNLLSEKDEPKKINQPSISEIKDNQQLAQIKSENENPVQPDLVQSNLTGNAPDNNLPSAGGSLTAPNQLQIKVLNGGAAAGTAGKARDLLNSKGYTKTTAANGSLDNYIGQTIFFQENNEPNANAVKEVMKAQYPNVITKAASSAEEKSTAIVVMMGK